MFECYNASCQSGAETEKQTSRVSLGSVSMQTIASQHLNCALRSRGALRSRAGWMERINPGMHCCDLHGQLCRARQADCHLCPQWPWAYARLILVFFLTPSFIIHLFLSLCSLHVMRLQICGAPLLTITESQHRHSTRRGRPVKCFLCEAAFLQMSDSRRPPDPNTDHRTTSVSEYARLFSLLSVVLKFTFISWATVQNSKEFTATL